MGKKKPSDVLMGARVSPDVIDRLDAIVADHALLGNGVIWTRSDVIRQALLKGMRTIEIELDIAHGRELIQMPPNGDG